MRLMALSCRRLFLHSKKRSVGVLSFLSARFLPQVRRSSVGDEGLREREAGGR